MVKVVALWVYPTALGLSLLLVFFSFKNVVVMSSPNSLFTSLARSFINWRKSTNLGLLPETMIFPAISVHLTLKNIGNFL